MRIIDVEQGSKEWLDLRRPRIFASEVAAILCESPYLTPNQLWRQKCLGEEPSFYKPAIEWGKRHETPAKIWFEQKMGIKFKPIVAIHDDYDFIGASLDGYSEEHAAVLEIKCPGKENFEAFKAGVPKHYWIQVQMQLFVSEAKIAYFVVFDGFDGYFHEVLPDPTFIEDTLPFLKKFNISMRDFEEPPLIDEDYPKCPEDEIIKVMREYDHFDIIEKQAQYEKKVRKTTIEEYVESQGYKRMRIGPYKFSKTFCKSAHYDMKKLAEETGIDIEKYRKPGSMQVRLTKGKEEE
jgi:putative phage-type endonuclease